MKLVINECFGGFNLSEKAYEKLIEWGIPVRKYIEQKSDESTRLYLPEPLNEGEVIFDRDLDDADELGSAMRRLGGRYWETWIKEDRSHALLIRVVDELGEEASGRFGKLKIVEIPDDVKFEIDEYDGLESVHEAHRVWN